MTPSKSATAPATEATATTWSEDALTMRARTTWSAGDFLQIARGYASAAEEFVTRLGLRRNEAVLDVACGAGNLALPAARAGARVTGIDIAPNLIAAARHEARVSGLDIAFEVGDAEALPYADARFDTTMTMFGSMFAYRPVFAAGELLRVTRSGGRVVMANWIPGGFVAEMLRAHTAILPPPKGVPSPLAWGDEESVRARLGIGASRITCTVQPLEFRFPFEPAAVTELFATCYGPTVATLAAADPVGASQLRRALTALWTGHNRATDGTTLAVTEYLEVVAEVD